MFSHTVPDYLYTNDGKRIFYCTNFSKVTDHHEPLLVFNYGLVCSNHHWAKQLPYFDKKKFKILIHDYRGHFNSSKEETLEQCNFTTFANDLHKIIEKIKSIYPINNIIMFGHSMGVNVTLEYAKLFPQELIAMVLISGTVFPPHDVMFNTNIMDFLMPYLEFLKKKSPKFFKSIWDLAPYIPITQRLIRRGGFNPNKVSMEFIQIYLHKIKQLGPDLFFKLFDEMGKHNAISYLHELNVPSLIIGGDQDKIIPNYIQNIIHKRLKGSEIYIVKDGSHVPQVDFPETINERILLFLNKIVKNNNL